MQIKLVLLVMLVSFFTKSYAEDIEIPEEELAKESVLPKFETKDVVKNRIIKTQERFEVTPHIGWNITEPIHNQSKVGINIGYHLSETGALVLNFAQFSKGLNSQYADGLASNVNASDPNLDFNRAPHPKQSIYLHYEWKQFYGKISFTKQGVAHLSWYPIFGVGTTTYDNKAYFGVDGGIGQKIYFSKNFGLRADIKLQYAGQPSPYLTGKIKATDPIPELSEFKDEYAFHTILDFGFLIMF